MTSIGLPTGGTITYTWTTVNFSCSSDTPMSRAIVSRTMNDNRGHSYIWTYQWGTPVNGVMVNTATDANGNDTVHTFTNLEGVCGFYETSTQDYQGTGSTRHLLKQVDTSYQHAAFSVYNEPFPSPGNVEPVSIRTTLYPSGKVSLVTKQYDAPSAAGAPILGNVVQEKQYDWGSGAPGPLLREVDTTYQWQVDSRYLTAGMLDLPNSVIVKDGGGCTLSKTTYGYDESGYLQTYTGVLPAGTYFAPPGAVRGNPTSVNKYLWNLGSGSCAAVPTSPSVVSHSSWYDTGELYQQIDPLGHITTHSYHSAYAGAYSTQTCNALNQCVSGTYDFNTGVLSSFTDANAGYQASGATPGDPAHTSNYIYDYLFRLTTAQAPPDPGNGNARAQTSFTFSTPGVFPLSVQQQKPIHDVSTAYFDGLARPYQTQHATPSGTVTVDTGYDGLFQVISVTNPYYNNTDPTFGAVQSVYDALGRATQTIKQDNSTSTADYTAGDNCVISSDEAGKQRRACSDALGRLTSVDEPGDSTSTGSPVAAPGTQASATVTITGAEQFATIPDPNGGSGGIGGGGCDPGLICDGGGGGGGGGTITIGDSGSVSVTINQRIYTVPYASADTPGTIAANLVAAINADSSLAVRASASAGTISLASIAANSAGSFTVTTSRTWDTAHFAQGSFAAAVTSIQGGSDGVVLGGHTYTTLYTYDALGNLLQVTQQGGTTTQSLWRVRTFTYDSLGRLLTANNPESGLLAYQYDNDSNLVSKTDARGITVNYNPTDSPIDALHRVTKKIFSNGDAPELFTYDSYPGWNGGSSVGRLIRSFKNGGHWFTYDPLGRVTSTWQCLPSDCVNGADVSVTYDLVGNITSLNYPSRRNVSFVYNSANQLDQVQFASWNGAPVGSTYWSASDTNFSPMGSPNSWTLGNGVTESAGFNKRLQLQQETVSNSAIHTLMDHAFNYGAPGSNNGNVMSVADQLNPARTQSFTYDALNRLVTANESRWGLGFVYDPWGNRLQQNVTAGLAGTSQLNVDNRNRITGAPANCTAANAYCYDSAGDLLNDNFHQYAYNAENQITQVDGGAATYTYTADGDRLRKDIASGATEYVYFGGNVIAEKNVQTGGWTDYIFANGKRIAKADSFKDEIALQGNNTAAGQYTWWGITGTPNVTVRTGDKLFFYHLQQGAAEGGMILTFSDGTNTGWAAQDQDGNYANVGTIVGQWHVRTVDLSAYAGKTINQVLVGNSSAAPTGTWNAWYSDIAIVSADGTVTPVYTGQTSTNFQFVSTSSPMASNLSASVTHDSTVGASAQLTTSYYHGDQIGSSRLMTAGTGWPIWQGTFLPFGEEYNPQISSNHYKFTGKERDNETGLDYFGARYYSNGLGRWLTPDWAAKATAVPYAEFSDPQTLNLYGYVRNLPISRYDADGHENLKPQDWDVHNNPTVTNFDRQISGTILAGFAVTCPACGRVIAGVAAIHAMRTGDKKGAILNAAAAVVPGGKLANGVSKLVRAENAVVNAEKLATRAQEIQSALSPRTQNAVTTAVGLARNADGTTTTLVSTSEGILRPAQRAVLQEGRLPYEDRQERMPK